MKTFCFFNVLLLKSDNGTILPTIEIRAKDREDAKKQLSEMDGCEGFRRFRDFSLVAL